MSKKSITIILGILIALMPFLGFPGSAESVFFVLAGLLIAALAYFSSTEYCAECKRVVDGGAPERTEVNGSPEEGMEREVSHE
ncbi:MAG: hypothetical protein BMS9Abin13_610 [Patescibacteria group bacterium]|nr:MAG: hypothetical protein BMS9Abin13_610 [Patescibacteria group bacterium]